MDCLKNSIGVLNCGLDESPSGLYINNLPGISTSIINDIANREEVNFVGVWNDINTMAARRLQLDVLARLRKAYRIKANREEFDFFPVDTGIDEPASNQYRGLVMQFNYDTSTFQSFNVRAIIVRSKTAGNTELIIADAYTGEVVWKKVYSVNIGVNYFSLPVGSLFNKQKLFIGASFQLIDGVASDITQHDKNCFCQSVERICDCCSPSFYGATFENGAVLPTEQNSHGVGVIGTVLCDYSAIVCNNQSLFLTAWMYLLGNQFIIHLLNSDRLNRYTTADREKYNELKDFYQVEYEKALDDAVESLNIDEGNNCCIECEGGAATTVTWLP